MCRDGFGDVTGDHWLGLHKPHQLANSRCCQLIVQLSLLNGSYLQQFYEAFVVANVTRLEYSLYRDKILRFKNTFIIIIINPSDLL